VLRPRAQRRRVLGKQEAARALQHFESAVRIDPGFADAHNDLGVAYFAAERYEDSLTHFQQALNLAPTHREANHNLCLLLLNMKRYADAGQAAERYLERASGSPIMHYAAAIGLLVRGGSRRDALEHLSRAEDEVPLARLLTAHVLVEIGRRTEAARQLQAYLRAGGSDEKRRQVEAWLAELNRQ
jgi:tetratricopeptide (TPR) repeat protein